MEFRPAVYAKHWVDYNCTVAPHQTAAYPREEDTHSLWKMTVSKIAKKYIQFN
jgi:hypothetical protein